MYFEIENTPEHIKRARRSKVVQETSPKDECPLLVLAPFSKPPQVIFENVLIGTCSKRVLEVFNPTKQTQKITLGKVPPGLVIQLPGEGLDLEPETCYCLSMMWTPTQPTAMRDTVRFTNENRGRYDVIVVLKSAMNIKGKSKGFKTSPGKMKKKSGKRSPVAISKKKAATQIKKTGVTSTHYNVLKPSNKDNVSTFDHSMQSQLGKCPFDSPASIDFRFDTTEIFSNMRKTDTENILQDIHNKSPTIINRPTVKASIIHNYYDVSASELFDNLTFTPMKVNSDNEKLEVVKIVQISYPDSNLDDSLEDKTLDKENIISTQPYRLSINHQHEQLDNQIQYVETLPSKKIPNTSSPKELNSPNFSMNTELSRISDLSFFPQRFSTEKKAIPKLNDDVNEFFNDPNLKLSSDTYTKDSPNTLDSHVNQANGDRPPHIFTREQPKICRQALFKESQQYRECFENFYLSPDINVWARQFRSDVKSPPRSITPPLQSIPEESANLCDTKVLDKTDKQMKTFTLPVNRTFDKLPDRDSFSNSYRQTWSKKSIRVGPELWKIPTLPSRKSMKPNARISKDSLNSQKCFTLESNKSNTSQNITLNQVGNVYTQSTTVDPFLSASYFYDEESVHKFEAEFRRWLNCILTPPADLDSNIEPMIDVGKAWIENRNKEVPLAPTREQVSSVYHNSHRLKSLRRSARTLLMSPEITRVIQKLNAQIEKKLIAIRNDRNLHLDVGLQKTIMELLLSYNPLWLRIGLETIYNLILPLKSNSDIEGLTTFIIQRMFKNPFLKNKHSKSSAPNMLLPAYMESTKKFTLKKFFTLVFFLDQAKQKKIISHDPCLFCRNATCKESREIIIRFTRELIAGVGDITKHLRPLGYVVCHKQSYLDEYKFAVHNIALDIRDGVRLTKVMEIILMKNGLLHQLRTPPISRLQKIHNVHVALNALKEANFVIEGDITAHDIADGHREKTLSLLWQLIHVFRAPLFEKAAIIIQTWWRKKYEVILEKRKEQELLIRKFNNAASKIQYWWRRIQYNRLVEWQMEQITSATIVFQKYCRMWLYRSRFLKKKASVLKIEEWYRSVRLIREAKSSLEALRIKREKLAQKSAIILQCYVRRWLCIREYKKIVQKVILIQSTIRCYCLRKHYVQLKKSTIYIQHLYRGKLLMREDMKIFTEQRIAAITIQSYYRMIRKRRLFQKLKKSVKIIEEKYIALIRMRKEVKLYQLLKRSVIVIQTRYKTLRCRREYLRKRSLIVMLQKKIRAYLLMKIELQTYMEIKKAAVTIQRHVRLFQTMKKARETYVVQRNSAILIQRRFRAQNLMKIQRASFINLRNAAITFQQHYRALLAMRQARSSFIGLKHAAIVVQRKYRAQLLMQRNKEIYVQLRIVTINLQRRFRAQQKMHKEKSEYLKLKSSCITIQNMYRAYVLRNQQREKFLKEKRAAIIIQNWFRSCKIGKRSKQNYEQIKKACVTIQNFYRAYNIGKKQRLEYVKIKMATVCVQNYYRAYLDKKIVRQQFVQLRTATVTIQRFYKSYLEMKLQRQEYLQIKSASQLIQKFYRQYLKTKRIRNEYQELKKSIMFVQCRYRSIYITRRERQQFLILKRSAVTIQRKYRGLIKMRSQREAFLKMRLSVIVIQTRFRAHVHMKEERTKYLATLKSCITIQKAYRNYLLGKREKSQYLTLKNAVVTLQQRYRALLAMRRERKTYIITRTAIINIQRSFRAKIEMVKQRSKFLNILKASVIIQRAYKTYVEGSKWRKEYVRIRSATIKIQSWYRNSVQTRKIRSRYLRLVYTVILTQRRFKAKLLARTVRRQEAARKIQRWFRSLQKRSECRKRLLAERQKYHRAATVIQAYFRGFKVRNAVGSDKRVAELRRRLRNGDFKLMLKSIGERSEEALAGLFDMPDIETVIRAFRSLELLTEEYPSMYMKNAQTIVRRVFICMSVANRSISSIELLNCAAALLVNLTRYRHTGPKIYAREHITAVLKFMCRFSNSEMQLICILCTFIWLFAKYDGVREDLTEYLNIPENQKMLMTIKDNIERVKRMAVNARKSQSFKFVSHTRTQNKNESILLPALETYYGITRASKPKYFKDAHQAIICLLQTYSF